MHFPQQSSTRSFVFVVPDVARARSCFTAEEVGSSRAQVHIHTRTRSHTRADAHALCTCTRSSLRRSPVHSSAGHTTYLSAMFRADDSSGHSSRRLRTLPRLCFGDHGHSPALLWRSWILPRIFAAVMALFVLPTLFCCEHGFYASEVCHIPFLSKFSKQ